MLSLLAPQPAAPEQVSTSDTSFEELYDNFGSRRPAPQTPAPSTREESNRFQSFAPTAKQEEPEEETPVATPSFSSQRTGVRSKTRAGGRRKGVRRRRPVKKVRKQQVSVDSEPAQTRGRLQVGNFLTFVC